MTAAPMCECEEGRERAGKKNSKRAQQNPRRINEALKKKKLFVSALMLLSVTRHLERGGSPVLKQSFEYLSAGKNLSKSKENSTHEYRYARLGLCLHRFLGESWP